MPESRAFCTRNSLSTQFLHQISDALYTSETSFLDFLVFIFLFQSFLVPFLFFTFMFPFFYCSIFAVILKLRKSDVD